MPTTSVAIEMSLKACMQVYHIVTDNPQVVFGTVVVLMTAYICSDKKTEKKNEKREKRVTFSKEAPTMI